MSARLLAYYLPQYHQIPENDEWWGKGFTEWTNVAKARPLFKGHWQPRLPADLGFYDLRVPEVREAQADLARSCGIEGFIYYHYWFGDGRRLLERPFNEVLTSGKPDLPFSLCWANHTWSGIWYGETDRVLIEQRYGGRDDYRKHFEELLPAFEDERYIRVEGKPLFQVYCPRDVPDPIGFTDTFRELAHKHGLPGLHLVAGDFEEAGLIKLGYDAVVGTRFGRAIRQLLADKQGIANRLLNSGILNKLPQVRNLLRGQVAVISYSDLIEFMELSERTDYEYIPCAVPNWDNTPRSGPRGLVVSDSTPQLFERHLRNAIKYVRDYPPERRLVFIKSWNEWAEGNYLEPDTQFGKGYLKAVRNSLDLESSGQNEQTREKQNTCAAALN